ncbi:MAG: EAL domain-containing protein [Pseudomonadota bacterium]
MNTTHHCECRSDERRLALIPARLPGKEREELIEAGRHWGWTLDTASDVLLVGVGGSSRFQSLAQIGDAIRGMVPSAFERVAAAWLDDRPLADQWIALVNAPRLIELAPVDDAGLGPMLRERRVESWRQRIIDLRDGRIWGHECLIRGRTPDGELVSAATLVENARREQLMFMFDRVCRETHAAAIADADGELNYLINFQPAVIYEPSVCLATTERILAKADLRPEQIIFEVVESERVEDIGNLQRIVEHYRKKGFRFALDDFGSAYSGLELLLELVPDIVKLDRAIVAHLPDSEVHRSICESIVQACHDHGIMLLAEGIETEAELTAAENLGIEFGQGYFIGRPQPFADGGASTPPA